MDWVIALLIVIPALGMMVTRSTWLVDYAVYVYVFNRGLRRIVDYYINEAFNPLSPISLTPLLITGLMIVPIALNYARLSKWERGFLNLWLVVLLVSGVIGILRFRFAALYATAEVLAPLAVFAYAFRLAPPAEIRDRWIRSFSWCAVLTSAYGWYQYMTIPPWDAFWLIETDLVGYMGVPEPTKMTVFSTMAERGALAGFLAYSIVPMVISSKWRTLLGWPAVILVFSVMILTLSRGGIIIAVASLAIYSLVNKASGIGQIAMMTIIIGGFLMVGVSMMPNSERITDRFTTLGSMQTDESYVGRLEIMTYSTASILANPFGYGLGASGLASRINTGNMEAKGGFGDGGYFDIIAVFGVPGVIIILVSLIRIWKRLGDLSNKPKSELQHAMLARALLISLAVSCFAGNFLTGFSVLWVSWATATASFPISTKLPSPSAGALTRSRKSLKFTTPTLENSPT